jgi:hypothetical protein
LLAKDRDVADVDTADIDDETARDQVSELVDADVVTPGSRDSAWRSAISKAHCSSASGVVQARSLRTDT